MKSSQILDDKENIDFKFISGVICHGSLMEKLHWMFSIFDMNNDGTISKAEMLAMLRALYKMNDLRLSARLKSFTRTTPDNHVNAIFKKFDKNNDDKLTLEEFVEIGTSDQKLFFMVYGKPITLER